MMKMPTNDLLTLKCLSFANLELNGIENMRCSMTENENKIKSVVICVFEGVRDFFQACANSINKIIESLKQKDVPEIEAFQYNGDLLGSDGDFIIPDWAVKACADGMIYYGYETDIPGVSLFIRTLEGNMRVNEGDYVIKGVKGEIYPCKPDDFAMTYEVVRFTQTLFEDRYGESINTVTVRTNEGHHETRTD